MSRWKKIGNIKSQLLRIYCPYCNPQKIEADLIEHPSYLYYCPSCKKGMPFIVIHTSPQCMNPEGWKRLQAQRRKIEEAEVKRKTSEYVR